MRKRVNVVLFSVAVILIAAVVSISFAYYTYSGRVFNQNRNKVNIATNSRAANVTSTTINDFNLYNTSPMTDANAISQVTSRNLTISNGNNKRAVYQIVLETASANTLANNLVSVNLTSAAGNAKVLTSLTETVPTLYSSGYNKAYVIQNGELAANASVTYNLRIYINSSGNNSNAQNKTWTGKIIVKSAV